MRHRSLRGLVLAALAAGLGLAAFTPGCKKEPESLIVLSLDANDDMGGLMKTVQVTVMHPGTGNDIAVQKAFTLPDSGLPMSGAGAFEIGIYVPSGVTGSLPVVVAAMPAGGACNGYVAMKAAKINGGDTKNVALTMRPGNVCTVVGTGGSGGSMVTGTGGSVGTCGTTVGPPPTPAPAPMLASCTEFDHDPTGTCDPANGTIGSAVINLAVSPDGQMLATSSVDGYSDGVIKMWRLQNDVPTSCGVLKGSGVAPAFVAFAPDGKHFAVAWNNDYVYIYSVPDLNLVGTSKSSGVKTIWGVGFSADSQTVFSIDWDDGVDGTLHADHLDGTPITETMLGVDPDILAVSPVLMGGVTTIAVAGYYANIGVYTWNGTAFSGPTIKDTIAGGSGTAIRFSRDGTLLAEGTDDGTVRIWNVPITAASVPSGAAISVVGKPFGLSFSAAGDQLAIGFGSEIDLWSVANRTMVARHGVVPPAGATDQYVDSTAFSASGAAVIVGEDLCGKFLICQ